MIYVVDCLCGFECVVGELDLISLRFFRDLCVRKRWICGNRFVYGLCFYGDGVDGYVVEMCVICDDSLFLVGYDFYE